MPLNLWKPEPKRRAGIVRPAVVPGLPLSRYTNTELGVRIARRSNLPQQDPGVAWARLMTSANRPEKDEARDNVLRLFTPERFPRLSILTFPASQWRFETALLAMRERGKGAPKRTQIQSLERDIAIFRAACHNIPVGDRGVRERVQEFNAPSFASSCVRSVKIQRFFCCTFEDYAAKECGEPGQGIRFYEGAWLDFNGQLSPSRLAAIERFWTRQLKSVLVVTLMNGRTNDWITGRVRHHGGLEHLLNATLPGSEIEHVMHYGDGAPMVQVTLRRVEGAPLVETEIAGAAQARREKTLVGATA